MDGNGEGAAFQPVPVYARRRQDDARLKPRHAADNGEPRCEMCGHAVIATHCKRICTRCGFMTGCSEGI